MTSKKKVFIKFHTLIKEFGLSKSVALSYAWSVYKENHSPYFEIQFKKNNDTITNKVGSNLELKNKVLIFYSVSDSQYKTAYSSRVLSLKAINIKIDKLV